MWSPLSVTVADREPPAVPERATSGPVNPVTAAEKTAVKWMGLVEVGSAWAAPWLMVTVSGGVTGCAQVTVWSVKVAAVLGLVAASWAAAAGMSAMTVPLALMPVTVTS